MKRPLFFWGVVVAAAAMLGLSAYAVVMIVRYGVSQDFGWKAAQRASAWYVTEVAARGAAAGKLEPGDVVLAVNGDERVARVGPFLKLRAEPPKEFYAVRVGRGSVEPSFQLAAPRSGNFRSLPTVLSLLLATVVFYAVGTVVGLQRPRDHLPRLLVFSSFSTALVLLSFAIAPISGFFRGFERYPHFATGLVAPLHLPISYHFLYRFTSGNRPQRFWTLLGQLLWVWGIVACLAGNIVRLVRMAEFPHAMGLVFAHQHFFAALFGPIMTALGLCGGLAMLSICAVVGANYYRTTEADHGRRVKWIIHGIGWGLVPLGLANTAQAVLRGAGLEKVVESDAFGLFFNLCNALSIVIPLSFGYAIAKHRVLDVNMVVRRGIQHLLARNVLRIILLLPIVALVYTMVANPDRTIAEVLFGPSSYFYLFIIAASGVSMRYRREMMDWVDRKFFRQAYDREKILLRLIENLKLCASVQELSRLVSTELELALHPTGIYLLFWNAERRDFALEYSSGGQGTAFSISEEGQVVRIMERRSEPLELHLSSEMGLAAGEQEWLRSLGVSLLVPLKGSEGRLTGLILLGEKKSEEPYSPNDRDMLHAVAGQLAVMYENLRLKERVERDRKIQREVLAHLGERQINLVKECPACGACFDRAEEFCARDGAELALALPVERTIDDRYRLDRRLGRGGMGAVYEALDLRLKRKVAVKVMLGALFGRQDALRRFEREAQASAHLSHPNIIAIHDYGRIGSDGAYLVMELLSGSTWRAELTRCRTVDPQVAAEWCDQVLSGLEAAHKAGVVHRDVKPENVMLSRREDGRYALKILDFGLAKLKLPTLSSPETEASALTAAGAVLGTYLYMSPEQITGRSVDERSDLFSLGVMVVETLTGDRPFRGNTLAELHIAILQEAFRLKDDAPEIRRLDAVLHTCLAKDPNDRYRSAGEMRRELIPALRACPRLVAAAQPPGQPATLAGSTEVDRDAHVKGSNDQK